MWISGTRSGVQMAEVKVDVAGGNCVRRVHYFLVKTSGSPSHVRDWFLIRGMNIPVLMGCRLG